MYNRADAINSLINSYYKNIPNSFFAPFLDNHDNLYGNNRLMDNLNNNFDLAKLAAGILLTFPGTPYVYYGTEIGMKKGSQLGDIAKRTPMHWNSETYAGFSKVKPWTSLAYYNSPYNVEAQISNSSSLLNCYKELIKIRKNHDGLRRDDIIILTNNNSKIITYMRPGTNSTILFVANPTGITQYVEINFSLHQFSDNYIYKTIELFSSLK